MHSGAKVDLSLAANLNPHAHFPDVCLRLVLAVAQCVDLRVGSKVVLPRWLVAEDLAAGRPVRSFRSGTRRSFPLNIIYFGGRSPSLRVRAFIEAAVQMMREEIPG